MQRKPIFFTIIEPCKKSPCAIALIYVQHSSSHVQLLFTATVFIPIWSDILMLRSNIALSNRAVIRSDFIRCDGWLRWPHGDMLAITKLCPCLSYYPGCFGHFENLAFSRNGGTKLTKQSNRMFLIKFSKVQ